MKKPIGAVFIGSSAGGIEALQKLLSGLPESFSLPIVAVQHLPANAQIFPDLVFGRYTSLTPLEATDKAPIEERHLYIAPPGYHVLVEGDCHLSLSCEAPVHFSRPSIDVLFESAAAAYGKKACGVLLTGANADGAHGLKTIQEFGGLTLVQDPREAEAPLMPQSALQLFSPDFVGDLSAISQKLSSLTREDLC